MVLKLEHSDAFRVAVRGVACAVSATGVLLLAKVIHDAAAGTLALRFFSPAESCPAATWFALGLSLPVPFHVISVGLIVQKRWLSTSWRRAAWIGIVASGCWLGIALAVKLLAF